VAVMGDIHARSRSLGFRRRTSAIRSTVAPVIDNDHPWEPPLAGTEAEHLVGALDRLRATFRWKADGLDAAGLQTRVGASSLTLGGLLEHLAADEDFTFTTKLSGAPVGAPWDASGWPLLSPRPYNPTRRVAVTRHLQGFTGIHPSGASPHLWPLDGAAALGLFPELRTRPSLATHVRAGTGLEH
jgi:hypothetical protein